MRITFLGTSAVFPTKRRNHQAVLLSYGGESLLFDCGEGTQRQIAIAKLKPMRISKIFISHWHGDHVLGLPGLLQSLTMNNRSAPLEIFGPVGTKRHFKHMLATYEVVLSFDVRVHELRLGQEVTVVDQIVDYQILAAKLKHPIPCLGFAFVEKPKLKINMDYLRQFGLRSSPLLKKLQHGQDIVWHGNKIKVKDATLEKPGKKIAYIVDTVVVPQAVELAKGADILICEGTFLNELKQKALERGHMTARQAGKLAKKADVKQLILTHFSQRYKDVRPLLREAKGAFRNTIAAEDFMEIKI